MRPKAAASEVNLGLPIHKRQTPGLGSPKQRSSWIGVGSKTPELSIDVFLMTHRSSVLMRNVEFAAASTPISGAGRQAAVSTAWLSTTRHRTR